MKKLSLRESQRNILGHANTREQSGNIYGSPRIRKSMEGKRGRRGHFSILHTLIQPTDAEVQFDKWIRQVKFYRWGKWRLRRATKNIHRRAGSRGRHPGFCLPSCLSAFLPSFLPSYDPFSTEWKAGMSWVCNYPKMKLSHISTKRVFVNIYSQNATSAMVKCKLS